MDGLDSVPQVFPMEMIILSMNSRRLRFHQSETGYFNGVGNVHLIRIKNYFLNMINALKQFFDD